MKHVFVFDPKSFYNQQWKMDGILDHIGQYFRTQENPDWSIQHSRYRRNALAIVNEELEKAKPGDVIRVYAIGGEEILFDCLNAVAHFPNMELAIVPHGEASDFLNIFGAENLDAFRDIPTIAQAKTLPTDIIKWGVNFALNSCYIGLNSAMASRLLELKTSLNKGSFVIFSKISSFFNYILTAFDSQISAQKYKVTVDEHDFSGHYSLIHVGNGPYHAGKITGSSDATPDDGLLDVALIRAAGPLGTMLTLRKYARGKRPKNGVYIQAKKVTIQSERQMWIQLDNEYIRDTSISMSVVPQAIQVAAVNDLSYPVAVISGL